MKQVIAADERGRGWIVFEDDTAFPLCESLQKVGLAEVVLPRETFLTGRLTDLKLKSFDDTPVDSIREFPAVAETVRRQARLQDCVEYLRRYQED